VLFKWRFLELARCLLFPHTKVFPPVIEQNNNPGKKPQTNPNNMKLKTILKGGASLLVAFGLSAVAHAAQIQGTIDFGGGVKFNDVSLPGSTGGYFTAGLVLDSTGDFSSVPAIPQITPVDFANDSAGNEWLWNSGPIDDFWQVGGFTFDLLASQEITTANPNEALAVLGVGVISGNGFDPTPGVWAFVVTNAGGNDRNNASFTFQASNRTQGVPDGGTTIALLGVSLLGLHGIRRKLARA
jgi:hypothetical protein